MIWILATRGAATKLRSSPYTETPIEGVHSVVYRPGIAPIAVTVGEFDPEPTGLYERGVSRISGCVFSYHGLVAETLLDIRAEIDLIIRYRASGQRRQRRLVNVLFIGDAAVSVPALNSGVSKLIGVPFRVQFPVGDTFAQHVIDEEDAGE
ncbi:MAG TPA: hypothetical protein PKK06_01165 [Phycisphaerae bacterium]|nr:hypothetical protein [Phycisphaerae bacterium]HNU43782.1 hypothetical protein [Phycisphaerae bacterium]